MNKFYLKDYEVGEHKNIKINFYKLKCDNQEQKEKLLEKYLKLVKKEATVNGKTDEDLLQEMLRLMYETAIENYDYSTKFSTYLTATLRNYRKRYYGGVDNQEISLENQKRNLLDILDSGINIENQISNNDLIDSIMDIIDGLDEREKNIFYYYYGINIFDSYTLREISEKVDLSHQGVKNKLDKTKRYILKKIKWKEVI